MDKCFIGWDDLKYNSQGRCCCNCKYQQPLYCRPWNSKGLCGQISTQAKASNGENLFVCSGFGLDRLVVQEHEHGLCEMHHFKTEGE